jgi:protein-tyrosine phosphatase
MMPPEHPIPNSYWVLPGRFLAGGYPGDVDEDEARAKVRSLLAAGVTFFLDLTEENELNPYLSFVQEEARGRPFTHQRMAIGDFQTPLPESMAVLLDTIDATLAAGHVLYLHCWGGSGRTGTVVGCYLVRHGMPGAMALREIARLRQGVSSVRRSPETEEQRQMVLNWPMGE